MKCEECGAEFDPKERRGKPGKFIHCSDCAEETTPKVSGNAIYSDKTAPELQINTDPKLTRYISGGGWGPVQTFKSGSCLKTPSISPHRRSHQS